MRTALLLFVLGPLVALAQTTLPLVIRAVDGSDTLAIGASQCASSVPIRWQYQTTVGTLCTPLKRWATEGECADTGPGTGDTRYDDVPAVSVTTLLGDNFTVKISELPGFKSGSATPCGTSGITKTHRVCGLIEYSTYQCGLSTALKLTASPLKLLYDTQAPGAPTITSVVAQDGAATLAFTVDGDTVTVQAEYKGPTDADFSSGGEVGVSSATQIRVKGLVNGDTYSLRLRAVDAAGNQSPPSDEVSATPVRTEGFWGVYRQRGGSDPAGCSAGRGAPALVALLAWVRRRNKR